MQEEEVRKDVNGRGVGESPAAGNRVQERKWEWTRFGDQKYMRKLRRKKKPNLLIHPREDNSDLYEPNY